MPEVQDRVAVPVSPEVAFDFVADIRNAPRWVFGVREVAGNLRHPLEVGDRVRIRLAAGGRIADSEWVIRECRRPELVVSQGRALGASATLTIACRPRPSGGTEIVQTLAYELPGGPLGSLAARFGVGSILELQARSSMRALRRLLPAAHPRSLDSTPAGALRDGQDSADG